MVNIMVTLYYGDQKLGQVTTNHSMSIEDILEQLDINMDDYAKSQGWDGWDYEQLRMEWH
jgi:hypothetical protein